MIVQSFDEIELAKTSLLKINDYDKKKLFDNFYLLNNIKILKNKRFKHIIEFNKKYKHQVDSMNETKRLIEERRVKSALKYIKSKSEKIEKSLSRIKQEKSLEIISLNQQKENNISLNIKKIQNKEEKERIDNAQRTKYKIERYIHNFNEHQKIKQKNLKIKNLKSFYEHEKNMKLLEEEYEQELIKKERKFLIKLKKEYIGKKERSFKKKQIILKNKKHNEFIKELQNDLEKKQMEKQKSYLMKINEKFKKKEIIELKKKLDLEKMINNNKKKLMELNERKKKQNEINENFRNSILENERELLLKTFRKKNLSIDFKKSFNSNSDLDNSLYYMKFNRELNKIKSQSITKFSTDKQKKYFLELLRENSERKKKKEEEKYNK